MLAGFKHEAQNPDADVMDENVYALPFSNDSLKKCQPDVFADDGVRFLVRSVPRREYHLYGWTTWFPYLVSLTTLPACTTTSYGSRNTIDVLDNPDASVAYDARTRYDQAMAMLTPTPLLCFMGESSPLDEDAKYNLDSSHGVHFAFFSFGDDFQTGHAKSQTVIEAYVIASMLKKMEDDGLIDDSRGRATGHGPTLASSVADKFEVMDFRKDGECGWRYSFALRRRGGGGVSLRESRELQKMLKAMVREDYASSFPDVAAGTLVVDFPEFSLRGGEVSGKSEVLSLAVESLRYDARTRIGVMRVRIGENQYEAARRYARRNIESLVRDKNIVLDGRDIPPAATFFLRGETLKGDILEITFKTE
jgi:hypothetical protein